LPSRPNLFALPKHFVNHSLALLGAHESKKFLILRAECIEAVLAVFLGYRPSVLSDVARRKYIAAGQANLHSGSCERAMCLDRLDGRHCHLTHTVDFVGGILSGQLCHDGITLELRLQQLPHIAKALRDDLRRVTYLASELHAENKTLTRVVRWQFDLDRKEPVTHVNDTERGRVNHFCLASGELLRLVHLQLAVDVEHPRVMWQSWRKIRGVPAA